MDNIKQIEESYFKIFNNHLKNEINTKILFSAPYGQGKTTFLNHFFDKYTEYTPIKLFPVNYSVASNEDIFQLIKHDILFNILSLNNFDFNITKFSHLETLGIYYEDNKEDLFTKLIEFIPKTGNLVIDSLDKIYGIFKSYDKFREKVKIKDEKKEIRAFLNQNNIKIGSIYEDDFITSMINDLLSRIKKPVLIIDDLDRLDPEHIFRILNIFSSHFDRPNKDDKFKFSKVIIVCDIKNIKSLYYHKYGKNADFHGYIDKFFSSEIFNFKNDDILKRWIGNIFDLINNVNVNIDAEDKDVMFDILKAFCNHNELSFRDIKKINLDYNSIIKNMNSFTDPNFMGFRLRRVVGLLKAIIGDIEMLHEKLKSISSKSQKKLRELQRTDIQNPLFWYNNYIFPVLSHKEHKFKLDSEYTYKGYISMPIYMNLKHENNFYFTELKEDYIYADQSFWSDLIKAIQILEQSEIIA